MAHDKASDDIPRPWLPAPPGRFLGKGHPAGDFLQADQWLVLHAEPGVYRIEAHLPQHVKNPRGQLFGGFTPTYIDLLAVRTAQSMQQGTPLRGSITMNMHVDYFEPVADARFLLESRIVHTRGRLMLVEVTFKSLDGLLLVFSHVTLRQRA